VVDVPIAPVTPPALPEEELQPVQAPAVLSPEPSPVAKSVEAIPEPESVELEKEEAEKIETIPKPEKKNWWEVKRETEVMAVEDLDGDMRKFEKHVEALGVAEKDAGGQWRWIGGNKNWFF